MTARAIFLALLCLFASFLTYLIFGEQESRWIAPASPKSGVDGSSVSHESPAIVSHEKNSGKDMPDDTHVIASVKERREDRQKPNTNKEQYWQQALRLGYGGFISRAMVATDGQSAYDAARLIKECETVEERLSPLLEKLHETSSTGELAQVYRAEVDSLQAISRSCQSVTGEMKLEYDHLLERGVKGGAFGAAIDYYNKFYLGKMVSTESDWLLDFLKADASKGEIAASYVIACTNSFSRVTLEERKLFLMKLKEAAEGSKGEVARLWLQRCENAGVPARGGTS